MKILLILACFWAVLPCFGQISSNNVDKITSAIYKIEGGTKTKYPFGIKSINTEGNYDKSRQICRNTIVNNIKRYQNQTNYTNYFIFLADRYCPPSADKQGNINWKKNIQSVLGQEFVEKFNKELTKEKM